MPLSILNWGAVLFGSILVLTGTLAAFAIRAYGKTGSRNMLLLAAGLGLFSLKAGFMAVALLLDLLDLEMLFLASAGFDFMIALLLFVPLVHR